MPAENAAKSVNASTTKPPVPSKSRGRWSSWFGWSLILIGLVVVSYPAWPVISYWIHPPKPKVNYPTQLPGLQDPQADPLPTDNRIVIPTIGVDMAILEGPDETTLNRGGVWHIPHTSDPLAGGNFVLSGHRWRYTPPSTTTLYLLDKVKNGEPAIVYWEGKEYDYAFNSREIVDPSRVDILDDTDQPKLTIFTCTPLFSTDKRLVLYAKPLLPQEQQNGDGHQ